LVPYDFFVGGAFSRATIFALGIMPYISSSIILQLLGAVIPYLEKLRKEGEEGQKKITQLTRYGTVLISIVQSYAYSVFLMNMGASQGVTVVPHPGVIFTLSTIITQTTGTIFVMWLGEKITEYGIGNGIADHLHQHHRPHAEHHLRDLRQLPRRLGEHSELARGGRGDGGGGGGRHPHDAGAA
jgi:hypothetical protein